MLTLRNLTAATVAATLALAPASLVLAQDTQTTPDTPPEAQQGAQTPVFADEQIDAFADAAFEMGEIQDKYAQKLQGVEDEAEQQTLLKQADTEMRATIEKSDALTIDDYLAINRAASTDEELSQKIALRLQKLQADKAG